MCILIQPWIRADMKKEEVHHMCKYFFLEEKSYEKTKKIQLVGLTHPRAIKKERKVKLVLDAAKFLFSS